jgi:hypothetical protein
LKVVHASGGDSLAKHSSLDWKRDMNEPEHRDQSSELTTEAGSTNTQDTFFTALLKDLNLSLNSKLTLNKARTVDNHTLNDDKLTSPNQIPDYVLKTLMIVNHRAREFKLPLVTSEEDKTGKKKSDDNEDENKDQDVAVINPMDALIAIFHCSDYFLRRHLAIKLSACQLSVPFLLPNPEKPSDDITILLSALESITKIWRGTQEVFATEHPFPVVSFIRIGKSTISKSSLINKIMTDDIGDHDFFFHKGMKSGDAERKIVDGLVELAWYLPGGSEEQTLKTEICFANLRGDAKNFKKQVKFLSKISSVFCILLPSEYPDETTRKILDEAAHFKAQIILIFDAKNQTYTEECFIDLRKKHNKKLSLITKAKKANEHNFFQGIRKLIQKYILKVKEIPFVELASCASELGIHLDGGEPHLELEESVNTWIEEEAPNAKDLLKLQTHVPVLASLEREKYCPNQESNKSKRMEEIYGEETKEMEAQKKSFDSLDNGIVQFLNCIAAMDESQQNYALSKLKHQLDKRSLAKVHSERETCQEKSNALLSEEEHVNQLEEATTEWSFGLEHIIRELAQLFQHRDISNTYDYASVAANMLLSGHSLELVDGHSWYIPLRWFEAVFTKLKLETNDAKVFVISVLGIQSSGKSTMLNTMFGLDFPARAGRCTRGVFASLIPVSDALKTASNFDYVLIVDTGGLRGSGDPELRKQDNKLATFAIGVADLTIVNVFGKNYSEIKEYLEIAVHAFLKMNLVKDKKSVKIVHHNVAAANATYNLTANRLWLKSDLDKMAKLAATQENCDDKFQNLNDIISFDENEDVFYLPALLKGYPPMAPVNPEYGRAVQKVKENIIIMMRSRERYQLSVSGFQERVCNLWQAMLKENFIFNFRNTIEIRAYKSLNRKCFKQSVNVMARGMAELERKIEVAIMGCETREEFETTQKKSEKDIRDNAEALAKKIEAAMEDFFETSEDKATLEQWRQNVVNGIKQQKENQVMEVTKNCSATFAYWENRQNVEEKKKNYRDMLLEKARMFIITSTNNTKDEEQCKAEFQQEWQQWMAEIPECEERKIDVNYEMVYVLCDTNPNLNAEMIRKLKMEKFSILKFKEMVPVIDIDQLGITPISLSLWDMISNIRLRIIKQQQQQKNQECRSAATDVFYKAEKRGINFAQWTSTLGVGCRPNDLKQLYHDIITIIEKESQKCHFKFQNCLKCDIVLHIFANVYEIFDRMEDNFLKERDIRSQLEKDLHNLLERQFVDLCGEIEKEVLAASSIVDVLQKQIESQLNRTMGPLVARKLREVNNNYKSKGQFHASALIQLGQDGKFESYIPYLENPVTFLRKYLMESIKSSYLKEHASDTKLLFKNEVKKIENEVYAAIPTANQLAKFESGKLTIQWIQRFVKNCSTLEITEENFPTVVDDLENIDLFEKTFREKVTQFLESLVEREVDSEAMGRWKPHEHLFILMFGCQSCCPFCGVLCDYTQNHPGIKHSTQIHRPQGLNSSQNVTGESDSGICTNWVATERCFRNKDTFGKWHKYKDYQSVNVYYNSWSILPDPTFERSIYWQWFVATFSKELAEHFDAKQPTIPATWKSRSFQDAEDQLRKKYHF